ncbi:MAG: peptide deformylase [Dehalococcoidales bacterium]|nr:peptide deformylase [Dehalococcoidales bacterium]
MAIFPIRIVPDPVLRQKSKRVRFIDSSINKLIDNMLETMRAVEGVGLAAPQIGISLRVIVIGLPEQAEIALINPQIVRRSGERLVNEGCLSVPGYRGEVKRAVSVTVKGRDLSGKEIRIKADELLAQALEHEINHLNGVLYIDQLTSPDTLRKLEPEEAEQQGGDG